ncbi:DinB family protein [Pedobacter sp. P351]|uniref:DinB family protein n=1 Tax=Pedobacter superstes TaxID=3133441 RepID=UPI0030A690B6
MLSNEPTQNKLADMNLNPHTVERLCHQHKSLKCYIDDLPPEAIYTRLSSDKFSIHETISYLTRYHHIFLSRLVKMMEEVNPFFEVYKPDADSEFHFTCAKSTGTLLHELYRLRSDIIAKIESLPDENFSRVGTHSVLGKMNITQWIEFFLLHESNQLFRIFKLAGSFWSAELGQQSNIIYLPRLADYIDELAV